jgi:GGDEF domain-containing protein
MEESLSIGQKQQLARRVKPFIMKNDVLCRMGQDNMLRRCLSTTEAQKVMKELHKGTIGEHFPIEIE